MATQEVWAVTFRGVPASEYCPLFTTKELAEQYTTQWDLDVEVVPITVDPEQWQDDEDKDKEEYY